MGIPHVDGNFLKSMPFFLPPISEQKEITNYLNKKCSDINDISHEVKEQVQILKEYKFSLILSFCSDHRLYSLYLYLVDLSLYFAFPSTAMIFYYSLF